MKRIRIIALCLVAAFALSAIAAAGASAEEAPEIGRCKKVTVKKSGKYSSATCTALKAGGEYEWTGGAAKAGFTGHGLTSTLETVGKAKVVCEEANSTGEYTGVKTVGKVNVIFGKKCTAEKTFECENGHGAGILQPVPLSGELHWENKALKHIALDLVPEGGGLFIEFTCGPLTIKVRGSVLVNIKAGKMETKPVQKFSGLKGKQKPEFYEEANGTKVKDILESENSVGKKFEQAGQTVTNTQTNEEALEANWFI
jgi:hypothetical protein